MPSRRALIDAYAGMMLYKFKALILFAFLLVGCEQKVVDMTFELQPEPVSKGPIQVAVGLARREMSIVDTQYLKLEVTAPVDFALQFPSLAERLEDFRQVPWRVDHEEVAHGQQKMTKYFAFELYESGDQVIPPLAIKYSSGVGEHMLSGVLKTPKMNFKILPLHDPNLFKAELQPAHGLLRLKAFPWLSVIGTVLLSLIVVYVIYKYVRRSLVRPASIVEEVIPAHTQAYMELQSLIERRKTENVPGEIFVAELSEILRRYIERQFFIHAPEQTTEEFLSVALDGRSILQQHAQVLTKFLEFSDLVKFATMKVADADIQQGFDFLKDFIEKTRPRAEQTA